MRILLAGVPFGCNNVGDEAILECAVAIFREVAPEARLTVSTGNNDGTAQRLGVESCGLFGFTEDLSLREISGIIARHDVFVWCGATGLSDYPEVTLRMMQLAQQLGKKTILWGVGMNDELNPAFYRVQPGRRRALLSLLNKLTLGYFDTISFEERRRDSLTRRNIARCLNAADLVVVRDRESRDEVLRSGVTQEVIVGADSAILLKPTPLNDLQIAPGLMDLLLSDKPKIGLCVSAQGAITKERELATCLDQIVAETNACIVGIPMNPLTDSALMARLVAHINHRSDFSVLTGRYQPAEILAVASRMNVIISSRLHLLILASIVNVPIVGIARGSKVDNFLNHFGLRPVGSVNDCDFEALKASVQKWITEGKLFRECSSRVQAENLQRLESAKQKLAQALTECRG